MFNHSGLSTEHKTLKMYVKMVAATPTAHQEFMASRAKYIQLKQQNPDLVLRGRDDLYPARIVSFNKSQSDIMSAPKQFPGSIASIGVSVLLLCFIYIIY